MAKRTHKQAQPAPEESAGPADFLEGLQKSPTESQEDLKLIRVVADFLKAHDTLESKCWPLLEVFARRLEKKIPAKKIASDFHWAFRKLRPQEKDIPNFWYKRVSQIQNVALMGRPWIEEHRSKGFGFWKLVELADFAPLKKRRPQPKPDRIDNEHFDAPHEPRPKVKS